jgi:hypothetical protein
MQGSAMEEGESGKVMFGDSFSAGPWENTPGAQDGSQQGNIQVSMTFVDPGLLGIVGDNWDSLGNSLVLYVRGIVDDNWDSLGNSLVM